MKKSIVSATALTALASTLAFSLIASAAGVGTAPGQDKLKCFDGTTDGGYGGVCTLKANGAKGPATLDNTDSNVNGDYAGVYIENTTLTGQTLSSVKQLGYSYTGTIAPQPGNLSLNVPVDTNNNNANDSYLFIDAYYCPGTAGRVDIINDPNCGIFVGSENFPNWAALTAAYPTWKVASTGELGAGTLPFVIAERTPAEPSALWNVNAITLGKPGK